MSKMKIRTKRGQQGERVSIYLFSNGSKIAVYVGGSINPSYNTITAQNAQGESVTTITATAEEARAILQTILKG